MDSLKKRCPRRRCALQGQRSPRSGRRGPLQVKAISILERVPRTARSRLPREPRARHRSRYLWSPRHPAGPRERPGPRAGPEGNAANACERPSSTFAPTPSSTCWLRRCSETRQAANRCSKLAASLGTRSGRWARAMPTSKRACKPASATVSAATNFQPAWCGLKFRDPAPPIQASQQLVLREDRRRRAGRQTPLGFHPWLESSPAAPHPALRNKTTWCPTPCPDRQEDVVAGPDAAIREADLVAARLFARNDSQLANHERAFHRQRATPGRNPRSSRWPGRSVRSNSCAVIVMATA